MQILGLLQLFRSDISFDIGSNVLKSEQFLVFLINFKSNFTFITLGANVQVMEQSISETTEISQGVINLSKRILFRKKAIFRKIKPWFQQIIQLWFESLGATLGKIKHHSLHRWYSKTTILGLEKGIFRKIQHWFKQIIQFWVKSLGATLGNINHHS